MRAVLEKMAALGARPLETLSPDEARGELAQFARLRPPVEGACTTRDLTIPAQDGASIPSRLYLPDDAAHAPVVLYFHGGGHVVGSIETSDDVARRTALQSGAAVLSVGYRKGPEHRFPAAVDDAWDALRWVNANGAGLGLDASRLAVMGESAGANLATVVALMARDAGGPRLQGQVLVYPVADYRLQAASFDTYARGFGVLSADAMRWFRGHYLASETDAQDWRASPILAPGLAGLPPALVIAAECDPLVDDVRLYALRLAAEGVPTELVEYAGAVHGFYSMPHAVDMAREANERVACQLKAFLRT
ncbi:alpha/beta hydrolase [Ramlibacter sp. PS3R-8]|uniref:alpha/beta hydrolase n=1 Tax=Ramlibacter sp. PS3R-8 TaxID=3133437 RepID=UPI0030A3FDF2